MDEGRPADPTTGAAPDGAPDWPTIDYAAADPGDGLPPDDAPFEPRGPSRGIVAVVLVLIVALVVFAVLGGRVVLSNPEPAAPSEQLLAVTDADGKLYTMDRAGGSVVEHSLPGIQFGFPGWSPDGTRIAVTGEDGSDIRLYVFDAASGRRRRATDRLRRARPAAVLPLLVAGRPADRVPHDRAERHRPPARPGRRQRRGTDRPGGRSAVLGLARQRSPRGAHRGSRASAPSWARSTSRAPRRRQVPLDAGSFRSPAVSRDGSHPSLRHERSGLDRNRHRSSRSTARAARWRRCSARPPCRSTRPARRSPTSPPSGRAPRIPAFPLGPLRAIDPVTGETRTLLGGTVVAFFWSPDGRTIAALTIAPPSDEVVGVSGARLASTRGSPPGDDGAPPPAAGVPLTLAFVDVASGSVRASHATAVTSRFVNNILPYYDQYALSHRLWARDSSAIALPLDADGEDQLFVIPADGSEMTPLAAPTRLLEPVAGRFLAPGASRTIVGDEPIHSSTSCNSPAPSGVARSVAHPRKMARSASSR